MAKQEKYEIQTNNKSEMKIAREHLWEEGWVVQEETYHDKNGCVKVYILKAVRPKED